MYQYSDDIPTWVYGQSEGFGSVPHLGLIAVFPVLCLLVSSLTVLAFRMGPCFFFPLSEICYTQKFGVDFL